MNGMIEDWIEVELNEIVTKLGDGLHGTPKYSEEAEYYFINGNNLSEGRIQIKENTKQVSQEEFEKYKKPLNDRTILVSINGTIGNLAFYNNEKIILGKSACYFNLIHAINKKFILFLLKGQGFLNYALESATGSTIKNVPLKAMRSFNVPLAPLPIQRAIVNKLEALFSDLDNGIADLKKAQEQLKIYRQAVLKKAFEGGFSIKEFELKKVNSLCEVVRGGSPRPAGSPIYYDGPIPFLKVKDITRNQGIFVESAEYSIKEAGLKKTRLVDSYTLLLTNSGATLGVPAISRIQTTFNDGIAAFLGLDESDLVYHYYYWCSKTIYLRNLNQGAAQPNLNTDVIGNMFIPVYDDKKEHTKIVQEIESRLSVCDNVQESIGEALNKSEALRQSILKKAFEGKLLSLNEIEKCKQEADYEPASELLKKIHVEKRKK